MLSILKISLLWVVVHSSIAFPLLLQQTFNETEGFNSLSFFEYLNDEGWDNSEDEEMTTTLYPNDDQYVVVKRMVSRNGFFLRIGPDGRVRGTSNYKDIYVHLTTFAVGPSLFIIRGTETGLYLSMDETGKVSARNNTQPRILCPQNFDILWRENLKHHSCFMSFQSFIQFGVDKESVGLRKESARGRSVKHGHFLTLSKGGRATSSATDTQFKSNFFLMSS